MIRIAGLRVLYGSFAAVDGLDLDIRRGELFGLLGPNGAGKSTTIRVLIGQRRPSAGTVTVAGHDVVREWAKIKPLFGYVPDRENHFEEFTGRRNLEFFAQLYGVPQLRADAVLKMVELDEAADLPVRGYSLGMRKKLLLARALLHEPPILYLDEPTANLDIHSAEVVHRILRERVKLGATVIMTTHDMDEVEKICDRVGIVCRGKLVALDSPLALRQEHTERKVDVIRTDGERLVFDMDDEREPRRARGARDGRAGREHADARVRLPRDVPEADGAGVRVRAARWPSRAEESASGTLRQAAAEDLPRDRGGMLVLNHLSVRSATDSARSTGDGLLAGVDRRVGAVRRAVVRRGVGVGRPVGGGVDDAASSHCWPRLASLGRLAVGTSASGPASGSRYRDSRRESGTACLRVRRGRDLSASETLARSHLPGSPALLDGHDALRWWVRATLTSGMRATGVPQTTRFDERRCAGTSSRPC